MTRTDRKINRKSAEIGGNALVLLAIAAGFGYYMSQDGAMHMVLDMAGFIAFAVAGFLDIIKAWRLFRTPPHIRYLYAIKHELGGEQ